MSVEKGLRGNGLWYPHEIWAGGKKTAVGVCCSTRDRAWVLENRLTK